MVSNTSLESTQFCSTSPSGFRSTERLDPVSQLVGISEAKPVSIRSRPGRAAEVAGGCGWGSHRRQWQDRWANWHWSRCVPDEGRPYGSWASGGAAPLILAGPPHLGKGVIHSERTARRTSACHWFRSVYLNRVALEMLDDNRPKAVTTVGGLHHPVSVLAPLPPATRLS